ncbi:ArnT family glycosyltransferase [Roseivirga sp.]|uniref:ArnT family glycosyltransferase n=1 Tax=Roseivirga sp. TaxID=1964215 RepID=UPI003B51C8FB
MTTKLDSAHSGNKDGFFTIFLIIWVVAGLIQNTFTEVSGEEAYYWIFSQFLDWGYLDHPPMIGVVTAPGYWLLPNALGLRLGMLVCNILTIIVIRKTLDVRDDKLLVWILVGCAPVHVGAALVKTDVPLLLSEALFFYFYKNYLKKDDLKTVALLALSIALIMLSKHHGFLVVMFTVLSNPKLFLKRSFWLTVGFTVLFMIPHTIWQYQHDFATIKFHLYNRIDMGFGLDTLAYYVGIQPVVFGPFIGLMLFIASFRNRKSDDLNRALRFTIYGVLIFFFISTFKVEFHKHWTSILTVPLILLGYDFMLNRPKWQLWLKRLSIATIVLMVPARIYLMYDFFPKSWTEGWDVLHGWDSWAEEVEELSGGLPIMFNNHYERASRYAYLTGDIVHCYNTFDYRETQHDLMTLEENLQGKRVFQINRFQDTTRYDDYYTEIGKGIHYRIVEDFRSFRKVEIEVVEEEQIEALEANSVRMKLRLTNHYDYAVDFNDVGGRSVYLNAHFLKGLTPVGKEQLLLLNRSMNPGEEMELDVVVAQPMLEEGKYHLRFSIQVEGIEPPINSRKYELELE